MIGLPDERLSPMTIGATGVKVYQNLKHAQIVNLSGVLNVSPWFWLRWENRLDYGYGEDAQGDGLPLMAPLTYTTKAKVRSGNIEAEVGADFVSRQSHYGEKYGETPSAGYAVWHFNMGWRLLIGSVWNHTPQKGRNIYANVTFSL